MPKPTSGQDAESFLSTSYPHDGLAL